LLSCVRGISRELSARVAVEDKVPGGAQDAAVDRQGKRHYPASRLRDGVERNQLAAREIRIRLRVTPRRDLIGFKRWRLAATRSLTITPPLTTSCGCLVRGDVHESSLRVVAHGEPRMPHARIHHVCNRLVLFGSTVSVRRECGAWRGRGDSTQINLLQRTYNRSVDSSGRKDLVSRSNVEGIEY